MSTGEVAQLLTVVVSGMAGLLVGSFLNVAVYRLPRAMSVVEPPSHCPACETRLTPVDLVPVLSWLWLRGRCRHCGTRISWRYPVVELATGLLCAAAAAALGSVWPLPSVAVAVVSGLAAAIVDADGGTVPIAFSLAAALAAVSLVPIAVVLGHADRLAWAAIGGLLGLAGALVGTLLGDRSGDASRQTGRAGRAGRAGIATIALLACLAWTAGWLWTGGGALVAAWIVVAAAATGLGARRQTSFALLAAGSLLLVLASALVSRP